MHINTHGAAQVKCADLHEKEENGRFLREVKKGVLATLLVGI